MLLPLTNVPRDYAWGSTTLLAELEGRAPTGAPEAEVWFGDHLGDPADVAGGGTLHDVTGGSLPYLLKLLAAGSPLSIQVHPTEEQALEGYAREAGLDLDDPARNYKDDNHKPELIVALSERFEALCGLRPVPATLRLLDAFGDLPAVAELRRRLTAGGDVLRDVIGWLLSGQAQAVVDGLIAGLGTAHSEEFAAELEAARGIARRYPGDPGVVVALLMNFVVLRRGEGLFLRAGLLHAYVSGLGVEIMAASDNVLRGGLTSKHIDVPELLRVLDTAPGPVPVLRPAAHGAVAEYPAPVHDFALRRVEVDGEERVRIGGPAMVLATAGSIEVAADSVAHPVPVPVGTAVFASADERALTVRGRGEVFVAQPGA
ncbi:mannose-6-phosphate isomerase, class I [Microbacterium neungamense]|uniref:mannose-6-phosphate isomerase, class I n=1 Tax=Microbacterium neungamense TaxID=2810535 RepID=UPI00217EC5E1|nr:mannose-6-phosphate isomerase, class I [Microbacterium neungamense]UWF78196.1 mannose-6-phosphate isomerase, class I [Microbacterium neungamense]